MEDSSVSESLPDLKDLETKIGRKTPEGLLRWMRDPGAQLAESRSSTAERQDPDLGKKGLSEKIRDLRLEMAYLRSIDVKILQQLVAVHEGIEAVKWVLEEKSNLTSRCSSLASSQYSLVESQDTSWRGSWNSLQDPNDRLDNISIGSYLDTLADEMDEYCPSSSESVICATQLPSVETGRTGGCSSPPPLRTELPREDPVWAKPVPECSRAAELGRTVDAQDPSVPQPLQPVPHATANGCLDKPGTAPDSARACLAEKLSKGSPRRRPYKNGKIDLEGYKLSNKIHLEYDAHWRWVQSQDDVTFL
ncbi:leucine rich adaptor protein 1 [Amia ocellicauda]|uniref:leucine rich adaptor protein 1 n=1 Tax=Amia ocellicauda TaxID=2972642 RepID=UPI0034644880